jgi:hypothetical protein
MSSQLFGANSSLNAPGGVPGPAPFVSQGSISAGTSVGIRLGAANDVRLTTNSANLGTITYGATSVAPLEISYDPVTGNLNAIASGVATAKLLVDGTISSTTSTGVDLGSATDVRLSKTSGGFGSVTWSSTQPAPLEMFYLESTRQLNIATQGGTTANVLVDGYVVGNIQSGVALAVTSGTPFAVPGCTANSQVQVTQKNGTAEAFTATPGVDNITVTFAGGATPDFMWYVSRF